MIMQKSRSAGKSSRALKVRNDVVRMWNKTQMLSLLINSRLILSKEPRAEKCINFHQWPRLSWWKHVLRICSTSETNFSNRYQFMVLLLWTQCNTKLCCVIWNVFKYRRAFTRCNFISFSLWLAICPLPIEAEKIFCEISFLNDYNHNHFQSKNI